MTLQAAPNRESLNSKVHAVYAAIRFLRVVRQRRYVLFGATAIAIVLGVIYCLTSPRVYQARASLLIIQHGENQQTPQLSPDGLGQSKMPQFVRLFTESKILDGAISRLTTPESRVDLAPFPREDWTNILRKNLSARGVRSTNIIEVAYRSSRPQTAELVVDAVVSSYRDFMDKSHKTAASELYADFEQRRVTVLDELNATKEELIRQRSALGDFALSDNNQVVHPHIHNVVKLNEMLLSIQQNRVRLEASLKAIQAAAESGGDLRQHLTALQPVVGKDLISSALGLDAQNSSLVSQLEKKVVEDQAKLESLKQHYGSAHPKVVELQQGIHRAEQYVANYNQMWSNRLAQLRGERLGNMLIGMVQQELAQVRAHEAGLREQFDAAESNAIHLNGKIAAVTMLQQDVKHLRSRYDTLGTQIAQIDISKSQANVRVAIPSPTIADKDPVSPQVGRTMVLSVMAGLLIGCLAIYVQDLLADRFQSPEEMREQLGAPVLAMVRQLDEEGAGVDSVQAHVAPGAVESEAFRTLRTAIAFCEEELLCVAITSSEPGDGKTTVLSNLGIVFAQGGRRTLLIDADLRRPGLTRKLEKRGDEGLSEVLQSKDEIGAASLARIQSLSVEGIDVLPSGKRPTDPTGLLSSERFGDLLRWAHSAYDQILIDSPPTLAASDAAVIGRLADGLILVVQPNKNNRRLVHRSVDELRATGVNLVGFVANRVGKGGPGYYGSNYGYGYGYGYDEGYGAEAEDASEPADSRIGTVIEDFDGDLTEYRGVLNDTSAETASAETTPKSRDEPNEQPATVPIRRSVETNESVRRAA